MKGRVDIGHIELADRFSLFEVPEADARMVVNAMAKAKAGDRRVVVDFDREKAPSASPKREKAPSTSPKGESRKKGKGPNRAESSPLGGRRGGHEARTLTKKEVRSQRNAERKAARKTEKKNRKAKQFTADDWKKFFK